MEEENKKENRNRKRILFLIFLLALTIVIVLVGTYAWFIGTNVVKTNSFEIKISAVETLDLSLDGEHWVSDNLDISEELVLGLGASDYKAYSDNKNKWVTSAGLYPLSFGGEVNESTNNGRLKLFIKSAMTATPGGYRFKADRIDNSVNEQDGYVAFDLFIRNGKGDNYNPIYNADDNEAIYLKRDSYVKVSQDGNENEDYGIANSIRVAFMQVGRVNWNTTPIEKITGINCVTSEENTGLCQDVVPIIWEPNNKKHNSNLIEYYNNVCRVRSTKEVYRGSDGSECETIEDGLDVDTYVVKRTIPSSEKTDIYDGNNFYFNSSGLENIDTFTDTKKMLSSEYRNAIFYLAPNSVTKLRIYVYLEGQDVDNNTIATLDGNSVEISFGFAKDIFSMETAIGDETASLEDYSWSQIKSISEQLTSNLVTYDDVVSKYGIEIGQTKKAFINGELHTFRLVDVLHDIDENGNTLGMTFEQVDLMNNGFSMTISNSTGWGNSSLKTLLDSFSIESDLDAVITPAKKSCVTSKSNSDITYFSSKLWLMSETEMKNSGSVAEGTPYKYYDDLGYAPETRIKNRLGLDSLYYLRSASTWVVGEIVNSSIGVCFCI